MPSLLVSKEEAQERIAKQLETGNALRERKILSRKELSVAKADEARWSAYTAQLLQALFDSGEIYIERLKENRAPTGEVFPDLVEAFRDNIEEKINNLASISERIDLMLVSQEREVTDPSSVFLVHGHDEVRESVARFLERLGLRVVILEEQARRGRTIIEQFEKHSSVAYAVILLTPDDIGAASAAPSALRPRARQNVIFELGYFCGMIGRSRVCALYKGDLELPSDLHGVLYVSLDAAGAWRLQLSRELIAAGMSISPASLL